MAHAVAAVAVVGKDNDPLFLQHFNDADELKFHYIVHTSLDIVEEKAASGKGGGSGTGGAAAVIGAEQMLPVCNMVMASMLAILAMVVMMLSNV